MLEADQRAKERHYRAWDLINAARGSTGDGGRRDALQDLNKDGIDLVGAPLEQAYSIRVDLQGANLAYAHFQNAVLWGANLQNTHLGGSNLQDASLQEANLQGADFFSVAILAHANLGPANLEGANLQDADLQGAFLQGAFLKGAFLKGAKLYGASLSGAHNLTQEQLDAATGDDRTVLPDGLTRPAHWAKAEGPEGRSAPQPDDAGQAPTAAGAPGPNK